MQAEGIKQHLKALTRDIAENYGRAKYDKNRGQGGEDRVKEKRNCFKISIFLYASKAFVTKLG